MGSRIKLFAAIVAVLASASCASLAPSKDATLPVAWTQFGLGDQPDLIARVLIEGGANCPAITVDGVTTPMRERVDPRSAAFGRICEERRPLGTALRIRIAHGDRVLLEQEVTRNPASIAVLGDTGCRVATDKSQDCSDPRAWPFARLADTVSARRPGLIVHLGDYYYREAPCRADMVNCVPGPYGDRGETWHADFFRPARGLIATAPWIFVRGNHEGCERGGYGWSYYFADGGPACETVHRPAVVRLAGLTFLNFDSAQTDIGYDRDAENKAWLALADRIAASPETMLGAPGSTVFLVTHEPAYGICERNCAEHLAPDGGGIRTVADRVREAGRRTIVLTGHIHAFQAYDVVPATLGRGRALTQIVLGNGGTLLDKFPDNMVPPATADFRFDDKRFEWANNGWRVVTKGRPVGKAQVWSEFGFGVLTPGTLELVVYDPDGARQFGCGLASETVTGPRCR